MRKNKRKREEDSWEGKRRKKTRKRRSFLKYYSRCKNCKTHNYIREEKVLYCSSIITRGTNVLCFHIVFSFSWSHLLTDILLVLSSSVTVMSNIWHTNHHNTTLDKYNITKEKNSQKQTECCHCPEGFNNFKNLKCPDTEHAVHKNIHTCSPKGCHFVLAERSYIGFQARRQN